MIPSPLRRQVQSSRRRRSETLPRRLRSPGSQSPRDPGQAKRIRRKVKSNQAGLNEKESRNCVCSPGVGYSPTRLDLLQTEAIRRRAFTAQGGLRSTGPTPLVAVFGAALSNAFVPNTKPQEEYLKKLASVLGQTQKSKEVENS